MDLKPDSQRAGVEPGAASAQPSHGSTGSAAGVEVKLSPGGAAELIKLSEGGALVEAPSRFSIGASVALCIGGPSPRRLSGRVVRCQVCGIHRNNTMVYQIGIDFDAPASVDLTGAPVNGPAAAIDAFAAGSAGVRTDAAAAPVNEW